ncbi:MAG TPA: alpha/beta hydrolase [Phycisphaerae bacterium]|nr:alpha/beta hydrolase [Phycisphaerae bacterium]
MALAVVAAGAAIAIAGCGAVDKHAASAGNAATEAAVAPAATIRIWPAAAPGEPSPATMPAESLRISRPPALPKRELFNVSTPALEVFPAAHAGAAGPCIIVLPGGGFTELMMDYEGEDCARFLAAHGVTAFVLKYRVPIRGQPRYLAAVQDTQRATSFVRTHAAEYHVDPHKIGLLGFSAGAISAAVAEASDKRSYAPVDGVDETSCRPDFACLIYPGLILQPDGTLVPKIHITRQTPPTFIAMADKDKTENAIAYYRGLKAAGVSAELHIYSDGAHGFGMRPTTDPHGSWTARLLDWLDYQKILPPA